MSISISIFLSISLYIYIYIHSGKNNNKQPIWEWCIPPIYGEIVDSLLLFYQHYIYIYI